MSKSEGRSHAARGALRARRVLVCASPGGAGASFAARLAASGYEVQSVGAESAEREIENFAPQVVALEARGAAGDDLSGFARKLRADRSEARLPLVIVFGDARGRSGDDAAEAARALARTLGADDCFALSTPAPEILARLDALFWRVETGRDIAASRSAHERRAEIEGFMQLLDEARAGVGDGASGALALFAATERNTSETADDAHAAADSASSLPPQALGDAGGNTLGDAISNAAGDADALRAAHEFFGRNLRRADSLAFYGPDQLLAYLPRASSSAAREDLARLHAEFSYAHPRMLVAVGLARFPEDGTEIEELIERAEASLEGARAPALRDRADESARATTAHGRAAHEDGRDSAPGALEIGRILIVGDDAVIAGDDAASADEGASGSGDAAVRVEGAEAVARGAEPDGDGTRGVAVSLEAEGARKSEVRDASARGRVASPGEGSMREESSRESVDEPAGGREGSLAGRGSSVSSAREAATSKRAQRALRESRRAGESFETSVLPAQGAAGAGGVLGRGAAEAAARERELRSRGARMPRRILLAVSDPARMAQINLLLRSASYEVRAAFDGGQALDLLRIERADLLVLDLDLKHFDGLEVLRRLRERHRDALPLPVLLLHPRTDDGARACAAARTLGARGFVALPYDPAELLEAARETGGGD